MSVTVHQRPGVYSAYDASSVISGRAAGRKVGLVGRHDFVTDGVPRVITSYDQALNLFGSIGDEDMSELIRLALKNGASAVVAVPVSEQYDAGFEALAQREDIAVVLCDSTSATAQKSMRDSVEEASSARRERIAVAAGAKGETAEELVARAAQLNSERVVLVGPGAVDRSGAAMGGLAVAAAVAGVIAGQTDPAVPLGGGELLGLYGLAGRYNDGELDQLILGGVTPVEELGGAVSVVRGVTTRTTTAGEADTTWRELTTILVVDDVIPSLRSALRTKFRRAKNTERGRGAIRAQVVLELENKLAREIISGYENVSVTADSTDPTRCLVDFSFTVAHGLNQIWLTAHITV